MKRLVSAIVAILAAVAACTAGGGAAPAGPGAVPASGPWGGAIEVPGLAALSKGGYARVNSVSCGSAGNCAIGASYYQLPNVVVPIVATERGGQWGKAAALPGDASPGDGEVSSVSCASAGNCLAGGGIAGNNEYFVTGDAFVVEERAGSWGPVRYVPGLRALEHGGDPEVAGSMVDSVACPSAGNCAAGGAYIDRSGNQHGFVAAERNGAWGAAIEVPGLAALNTGRSAEVSSVSCGSVGNCAAGGYYTDGDRHTQGFVAVEENGAWGAAIEVPGLRALNAGGGAEVSSVSCGSAGNCVAGGGFADGSRHHQGFVAAERNGAWGAATRVPGLAALNAAGSATQVLTVSCAPADRCAAGGSYLDRSGHQQGFVASEDNGVWGKAIEVPGLGALNAGGSAEVDWLSCPSPGKCAVGGFYTDASGQHQGFVT